MGKGSKQQPMQASSQSVTQTNIPEYARPYFEDLMSRTQQESINEYQPYTGQRLADQSGDTTQAYANLRAIDPSAGMQQARDYIGQAGQAGQTALGYGQQAAGYAGQMGASADRVTGAGDSLYGAAGDVRGAAGGVGDWAGNVGAFGQRVAGGYKEIDAPRQWDAAARDEYMSPYQQGVTDIAKREAIRDDNINRISRNTAAQRAGAFGGSRQGVVEGMAQQGLGNRLSDMQTQGLQSAYTNAQQQFGQDRSASMAAQIENARNALQGGNMMTSAGNLYGTQGQLYGTAGQLQGQAGQLYGQAGQLQGQAGQIVNQAGSMATDVGRLNAEQGRLTGALSQQEQQQQMQKAQALQQIGAAQEGRQQASLDTGYTDFMNQRDYPRQNLNFYSGILRGMNVQPQSDVTSYQAAPNPLNQLLGLGVSAAGAYMGMR